MIKDHFTFSVREQRGIFLLSVIMLLTILLRIGMPYLMARRTYDFSAFEKQVRLLESMIPDSIQEGKTMQSSARPGQLMVSQRKTSHMPGKSAYIQESSEKFPLVDLNAADSMTLVRLRGIGPVLAARIIKYRESLGGFANVNQLKEIYGMDTLMLESIIPFLTVDVSAIRRMNLNTASFKELLHHPYLEYEDVKRIVNYRDKHQPIDSLNVLFGVEGLPPELVRRMLPYLTIGL